MQVNINSFTALLRRKLNEQAQQNLIVAAAASMTDPSRYAIIYLLFLFHNFNI